MKILHSIQWTNRGIASEVIVAEERPTQLCRFDNQMLPVEEVVSMLLCSGMGTNEIFRWLERRMEIGKFTPITEVIQ